MARCGLAIICAAAAVLCGYAALVSDGTLTTKIAFAVVLTTRIVNGIGVAILHPAAQAWLWAGVGDEEGVALQSWASAAQNAGRFLGPVGVALVGGSGVVWTLAGLVAVSAVATLVLVLAPGPAADPDRSARRAEARVHYPLPVGTWALVAALLALHLMGGATQFLLGPLLMARLELDASEATRWAGWLMALAAAASVVGNLLARRRLGRRRALAGAGLATAGAVLLAPFTDLALIAAGVAAAGVGIGAAVPATMAELMRRTPSKARGRTAGRTTATQAAGYALAAPIYGALFAADPILSAFLLPVPPAAAWLILVAARRAGSDINIGATQHRHGSAQHPSHR
jgi:MFS family permease